MKRRLRKQMREKLLALPSEVVAEKSRAAAEKLAKLPEFADAKVIMAYLSIAGEVDTTGIVLAAWRAGKTVLVPKVSMEQMHMLPMEIRSLEDGLTSGSFGIREPAVGEPWPIECIDFILVPALAFDRTGHRLGRGGGFYDRFLARPETRAVACGLGFAEQLVDELPVHEHDYPIDLLVTDREVLRFDSKR